MEPYSALTSLEVSVFICYLNPTPISGGPWLYSGCPLGTETEISGSLWDLRTALQWAAPQPWLNTGSWEILPYSMLDVSNLYVELSVRASAPSIAQDWNLDKKEWRQWEMSEDRGIKRWTAERRPREKGEKWGEWKVREWKAQKQANGMFWSFYRNGTGFPCRMCTEVAVGVEWQNYPTFEASEVSVGFWTHNSWKQPKTSEYPCSFHV